MKTDALIDLLATGAGPVAPGRVVGRFAITLGLGTALAVVAMASLLGPRHDLAQAVLLPMFWVKTAFVVSLAAFAVAGAFRAARPGASLAGVPLALGAIVAAMWVLGAATLADTGGQAREALFFGRTWRSCPWLIAALSLPVFVAIVWAMRALAPTRLHLAGAMAGLAAGTVAATVYSIHCPELAAPFLGTWYLLGMLVPTAVGAVLGPRLFRW